MPLAATEDEAAATIDMIIVFSEYELFDLGYRLHQVSAWPFKYLINEHMTFQMPVPDGDIRLFGNPAIAIPPRRRRYFLGMRRSTILANHVY